MRSGEGGELKFSANNGRIMPQYTSESETVQGILDIMNAKNNVKNVQSDDPLLDKYAEMAVDASSKDPNLYHAYNVKRGLRNADGSGVLVGLTTVGGVVGYTIEDNELIPVPGKLLYRGIEVRDLVRGFQKEKRFGFDGCRTGGIQYAPVRNASVAAPLQGGGHSGDAFAGRDE